MHVMPEVARQDPVLPRVAYKFLVEVPWSRLCERAVWVKGASALGRGWEHKTYPDAPGFLQKASFRVCIFRSHS